VAQSVVEKAQRAVEELTEGLLGGSGPCTSGSERSRLAIAECSGRHPPYVPLTWRRVVEGWPERPRDRSVMQEPALLIRHILCDYSTRPMSSACIQPPTVPGNSFSISSTTIWQEGCRRMVQPQDVSGLLVRWCDGDREAFEALVPMVYTELRQVAGRRLRHERVGHSVQPTDLCA
jgi:hypothetical protein